MHDPPPDIRVLAETFEAHALRWVLVGGAAVIMHGSDYVTTDSDVAFAPDLENVDALADALNDLNARPVRIAPEVRFKVDRFLLAAPYLRLKTDAGVVDLMRRLAGIESFEGLYSRALIVKLGTATVRVASIDDLIAMKSGSERTKDKLHVMDLLALKKLNEEGM